MLVPSPTQALAVRDWLANALLTDDLGATIVPAPFADSAIFLGERDHPRASTFARIATVAIAGRGVHQSHVATGVGTAAQALAEVRGEHREWTTSITVASRLDPTAPSLADEAGQHLQRALGAFRSTAATYAMRSVGVAAIRHGEIQDVARLTGAQQWETRCSVVLTWLCGWRASTPVEWVESVQGSGYLPDILPDDLVWRPLMRSLWDPVTRQTGVNDGTDYDPAEDARIFTPSTDDIQWTGIRNFVGQPTTVTMWIWFDDMVERRPFLARSVAGSFGLFVNSFSTGNLRVRHENDGGTSCFKTTVQNVVVPGRWYHLAWTYDGSNTSAGIEIWLDGQLVPTASQANGTGTPRATSSWGLGYSLAQSVSHLGRIRDPRAWGVILTQEQIQQVMVRSPLPFDSAEGA